MTGVVKVSLKINVSIPNRVLQGGAIGAGAGAAVYVALAGFTYVAGEIASFGFSGQTPGSVLKSGLKTALPVLMVAGAAVGGFIAA